MILLELLDRNVLDDCLWRRMAEVLVVAFLINFHSRWVLVDSIEQHIPLTCCVDVKDHLLPSWRECTWRASGWRVHLHELVNDLQSQSILRRLYLSYRRLSHLGN